MVGADTIIRIVAAPLALFAIAFITGVAFMLLDPIYNNVIDTSQLSALGWGTPQNVVMLFAGLGFIGLSIVVIVWLVASPIREDVRQQRRPPF